MWGLKALELTLTHEKELLKKLGEGSEIAFTKLFHAHKNKLYSFVLRLSNSQAVAEDVVQDVFTKLWRDREKIPEIEHLGSYLFRMAQNHFINNLRRAAKETLIIEEIKLSTTTSHINSEEALCHDELQALLKKSIERLPSQQRQVYSLTREHGISQEEIAKKLNISVSTVKNHMTLALKFIRQSIKGSYLNIFTLLF